MPTIFNWYTTGSPYEEVAKRNALSFAIAESESNSYAIEGGESWVKNCALKPTVCLALINTIPEGHGLWLLDADAEIINKPDFRGYNNTTAPYFSYVLHYRPSGAREVLSGTLWITNTPECKTLLANWQDMCQANPDIWDQKILSKIVSATTPIRGKEPLQISELDWRWAWISGISDPGLEKNAYIRHNQMSKSISKEQQYTPISIPITVLEPGPIVVLEEPVKERKKKHKQ